MKYVIACTLLLAVVFLGCLWYAGALTEITQELSRQVQICTDLVDVGESTRGAQLAQDAQASWEKSERALSAALPHGVLSEITESFSRFSTYLRENNLEEIHVESRVLLSLLEALSHREELHWANIL